MGDTILNPPAFKPTMEPGSPQGIIGLCNKGQPRKLDDWGALRAWIWGASAFETNETIDAKHVDIDGDLGFRQHAGAHPPAPN